MIQLYNVHQDTLELLPDEVIPEVKMVKNPKYDSSTHSVSEKWVYNHRTSTIIPPPECGSNEIPCLVNGEWVLKADYRGNVYWNTITMERHEVESLDFEPSSNWTEKKPAATWQIWNGVDWQDDFHLWLDQVLRPQRDKVLAASDKYILSDYPLTSADKDKWLIYRQELRDLPLALTAISNPIPWPKKPEIN